MKEEPTIFELLNEIQIISQDMQSEHEIREYNYEIFKDCLESICRPVYPVRIHEAQI